MSYGTPAMNFSPGHIDALAHRAEIPDWVAIRGLTTLLLQGLGRELRRAPTALLQPSSSLVSFIYYTNCFNMDDKAFLASLERLDHWYTTRSAHMRMSLNEMVHHLRVNHGGCDIWDRAEVVLGTNFAELSSKQIHTRATLVAATLETMKKLPVYASTNL